MQTNVTITLMKTPKKMQQKNNAAEPAPNAVGAHHILYLVIVGGVFAALTVVSLFFPRTTYSELEKRDLAEFPDMGRITEAPAEVTADISHWFSDSEPFRDEFMTMSMRIRDAFRYTPDGDEEAVSFRPSADMPAAEDEAAGFDGIAGDAAPGEYHNNVNAEENAKVANAGIIIVGSGEKVRALMAYGGTAKGGGAYVSAVNAYAEAFPGVNVYAMPVPTATEFYLPEKAAKCSNPQRPTLVNIHNTLSPSAKFVDVYSALAGHVDEDIYLRTDHHWAPLGGYYAARQLAHVAGVPFRDLSSYEPRVVHRFVGSMYGYSKDISVKNAPEDFVYHIPVGVDYTTTYVTYNVNKNYEVTSESKPYTGRYFHQYKDGSGAAYLTFMGGDQHLVKVRTSTPGSRRLLVIKDSYGNTLPGYLFFSFNEIHVVDFRYFTRNMKKYVADNGITDIVIAFNIFNAYGSAAPSKIKRFLTQAGGSFAAPDAHEEKHTTDSANHEKGSDSHRAEPVEPEPETVDTPEQPVNTASGASAAVAEPDAPEVEQ